MLCWRSVLNAKSLFLTSSLSRRTLFDGGMKLKVLVEWDLPTTGFDKLYPLLDSLTANFTSLAAQPPGYFFTVPEHLLVDNYTVYKSPRLIKNKPSGPDPIPGTAWKEFAFALSPTIIMDIYNASMIQGYVPNPSVGCCPGAKVLSAKIRWVGSTSNFTYVAPCEDHGGLYYV